MFQRSASWQGVRVYQARRRQPFGLRLGWGLALERLEDRRLLAISSDFTSGVLSVSSDADDAITISTDASGNVLVNGGDPDNGSASSASVQGIAISGGPGANSIDLSGVLLADFSSLGSVNVFAGGDADAVTGSQFGDTINGQDGNDTLVGGPGADQLSGDADADVIVWNPGDGSDVVEGGADQDMQIVNGGGAAETFQVQANAGRVDFDRLNNPFSLDIDDVETLELNAGAGNDVVTVLNLAGTDLGAVNLNGAGGDDSFALGDGASLGSGTIDGGTGANTLDYSAYSTSVSADLQDELVFTATLDAAQEPNGASTSTATGTGTFTLSALQTELTFEVLYAGIQGAALTGAHFHNAAAGVNGPIVRGLTTTELNGSTVPNGTLSGIWSAADPIGSPTPTSGPLTPALVAELKAGNIYFNIHSDIFPGGEIRGQLTLLGTIGTATGTAGVSFIDNVTGGQGDDSFVGNDKSNTIQGGGGKDTMVGGGGDDALRGGGGDDTLVWNNGDGSDLVEGGAGNDILEINGAPVGDAFVVAANGARVLFSRQNLKPFSLDTDDVERLLVRGLAGEDTITMQSLVGTDVLAATLDGGADDDTITFADGATLGVGDLDGGTGFNTLSYAAYTASVTVDLQTGAPGVGTGTGINSITRIQRVVGGSAGDTLDGGNVTDVLEGGPGNDRLADGGGINDQLIGGDQDDRYVLSPAASVIIIDAGGSDTLDFSAATAGITIDLDIQNANQAVNVFSTVHLAGQIENMVGSAFDDAVFVDPLLSPRSLSAGGQVTTLPGDTIHFDAQGAAVVDNGTDIVASGFAAVTATGFETRNITNALQATPNQRFVLALYLDLLLRPADSGGLAFWTNVLLSGATRLDVAAAFTSSTEFATQSVRGFYFDLLGRAPDQGGSNFFVAQLTAGASVDQVRAAFIGSAEYFQRRAGNSTDGFLNALFDDVLGRAFDPLSRPFFDQLLLAGSRTNVALHVLGSREADEVTVDIFFRQYLDRAADPAGRSFHASVLQQGTGEDRVIAAIVASDEYFSRV